MRLCKIRMCLRAALLATLVMAFVQTVFAQGGTGTLRGQVTDPSGAVVSDVSIVATSADGQVFAATTGRDGVYEMNNLTPGSYKVQAIAKGFAIFEKPDVAVVAGQTLKLDIALVIEKQQEKVVVSADAPRVDVNPENNASAVVISGKELDALSDDPDELQTDLEALAGPSAGPSGGQMYIDGFTAGQLPPKASIREIRINQNPFSSEYDKLGYGRIEIFTKPGTDKFHGQMEVQGNDSSFNSKNPFLIAAQEPPYDSVLYNGNIGGPINKKSSFFFDFQRRDINDIGAVDATILDSSNNPTPFVDAVPNNRTRTNLSPRLDYQLSKNNTLSVRYQFWRENDANNGVGQFSLPSQGYDELDDEHTVQVSDTQIIGSNIVNETRFQYLHEGDSQKAQNPSLPSINVLGYFVGGGNSIGIVTDTQNHYEFQNYTSWAIGKHVLKFGARLRWVTDANNSTSGFNGTFSFLSLTAYAAGQPEQLTINTGIPTASVSQFDAGPYIQDDWRVRPNFTVSGGLRLESQNNISDHADWAPRVAFAWGLARGKNTPKTVLRAGWGVFYDRFSANNVLQTLRFNGLTEQSYVLSGAPATACYPSPSPSCLAGAAVTSAVYQIDSRFHSPYTMQTAVSLERQLTKIANLSLTYMNSRGVHQLYDDNINAPEPGTFTPGDPATWTTRPYPGAGNIFQYIPEAVFKQNQFIVNSSVRAGAKLMLFGYYTLNYANGDVSTHSNPYDVLQDYGRASFDIRNRFFMGGTVGLPYAFRFSPFLFASSGAPYNVTLSQDLIGTSVFNQRPAFATSTTNPNYLVSTALGTFNANPGTTDTPIPINDFTGPARVTFNFRFSKTFGFGKPAENAAGVGGGPRGGGRGPGGPYSGGGSFGGSGAGTNHRYNLTFGLNVRNAFNHPNLGQPVGVLNPSYVTAGGQVLPATASPVFGQSIGLAGGPFSSNAASRLVYLQASFSF